ncbi:MAG: TetR/AcrR family transcriptional regulator [Chloroflexota bacterium]|nr:TetR/AcrR family transcriptional regulator [Anaerolineales bacterium]
MTASETRDKILQVARRLFAQQGYTATSMRQVAEEAGIGKATIYHHFQDKQSIAIALLDKAGLGRGEALQLVQRESDPRKRIRVAMTANFDSLLESLDIMQIVRREVPGGREQMQAGFVEFFQDSMALLTDALQRGTQEGIFRPVNPAEAARILMTMIVGTFALTYLGGGTPRLSQEDAEALLDVYFHGIETH